MATRITITPKGSPGCYRVTLDGQGLIGSSKTPFLDSARVLQARGITGTLEMWDETRPYPRMVGDIAHAARLTVKDMNGERFARWMPFAPTRRPQKSGSTPDPVG